MFKVLDLAPQDPILGLSADFKRDPRPDKINLASGVYQNHSGATPTLASVRAAEERLLSQDRPKTYLPIEGGAAYLRGVLDLIFGSNHPAVAAGRVCAAHTPGGTGALRIGAEVLRRMRPDRLIWFAQPTWPNHRGVFEGANMSVGMLDYYAPTTRELDWERFHAGLSAIPEGDCILLQVCCQNPTGIDPSHTQWASMLEIIAQKRLFPIFDFAYQGFATGLTADTAPILSAMELGIEFMVASSFSKNMGLYAERVGALSLVAADADGAARGLSQVKSAIRTTYSNPPLHGSSIAEVLFTDPALNVQWRAELESMRLRLIDMRTALGERLATLGAAALGAAIARQCGMFSLTGIPKERVEDLRAKQALYLVGSGRINVAALNAGNVDRVAEMLAAAVAS